MKFPVHASSGRPEPGIPDADRPWPADTGRPLRIAILAGEESGDRLGGALMQALSARRRIEWLGVGGEDMTAAGIAPIFPLHDIAVMGVDAIVRRLPQLLRRIAEAARAIEEFRPDVLVIIDAPEFNHRVAKRVRRWVPRVPIVNYVSPTVWAWRPGRARAMRPYVDLVLALFPFEPAVHERLGGPRCVYVGHPLFEMMRTARTSDPVADEVRAARITDPAADERVAAAEARAAVAGGWSNEARSPHYGDDLVSDKVVAPAGGQFAGPAATVKDYNVPQLQADVARANDGRTDLALARNLVAPRRASVPPGGLSEPRAASGSPAGGGSLVHGAQRKTLLILPGSRHGEIERLMPVFGATLALLKPDLPVKLLAVSHLRQRIEAHVAEWSVKPEIVSGPGTKLIAFREARAALAASGTVTLELAAARVPMVVAYKLDFVYRQVKRLNPLIRLITAPSMVLANIVIGRNAIPAFLEDEASAEALAEALAPLLAVDSSERRAQETAFDEFEAAMAVADSPADRAAEAVLSVVGSR